MFSERKNLGMIYPITRWRSFMHKK